MRDIEDLLPRIMEKAPACPEPTAIAKIRDAAREFLRRARLWRDTDSFEVTLAGCDSIGVPEDSDVIEIAHASFVATVEEGQEAGEPDDLTPITLAALDHDHPGWRSEVGTPEFITQLNPGTLRLVPKAAGTLTLELILRPSERATALPDFLVEKYAFEICEGALGEVLAIPGDFANPGLALDARRRFQEALDHYGSMASKGQQRARRRTRTAVMF